jgi:tetratricopeptide (TPR) repeat protein
MTTIASCHPGRLGALAAFVVVTWMPAAQAGAPGHADAQGRVPFEQAVADGRHAEAARHAERLLGPAPVEADLLDELTYRLTETGGGREALQLLMTAYPFTGVAPDRRDTLVARVALLAVRHRDRIEAGDAARLRVPLDRPALRQRQGVLWTELGDCAAVRAVLGDLHSDYEYDDLLRLGACSERDEPALALRAYTAAGARQPGHVTAPLARGYLAWQLGRTREARDAFEDAWRADPGNLAIVEQLVYVYQRLHENDRARRFAARIIDAGPAAGPDADAAAVIDARRYGLRRLHEDLGRRMTMSVDGFSGTSIGAGASQADGRYSSYGQAEIDVRLGRPAIRNGRTLSAFARLTGDGGVERHAAPVHNATLGAGLRWKPLSRYVLYLSGEGRTALDGSSRRDVLLRASASLFNAGRFSDDWRPGGRGWLARNLYLDAAHFVDARYTALTADLRTSYHVKAGAGRTVEPYARLQGALHRSDAVTRELRAGAGARWNVWYGGSPYDAPPHQLSIGFEFQQAIETTLPERRGVFLRIGSRW